MSDDDYNYDEDYDGWSSWLENLNITNHTHGELTDISETKIDEAVFASPVLRFTHTEIMNLTLSTILGLTGFIGNCLVIFVIIANRKMRSTTNLLIVNLAAADLLFILGCLPLAATTYIIGDWIFGLAMCKIFSSLISVTPFIKMYTLLFMSLDRFLVTICPVSSKSLRTKRSLKMVFGALWTASVLIAAITPFFVGIMSHEVLNREILVCNVLTFSSAFTITNLLMSHVVPVILIIILLLSILVKYCCAGANFSSEYGKEHIGATRMTAVISITCALMFFPHWLIYMLTFWRAIDMNHGFLVIIIVGEILHVASFCINPLLYAFMSLNFRGAFKKALQCSSQYQIHMDNTPTYQREPSHIGIGTCSTAI